jgi:hypothetical protein
MSETLATTEQSKRSLLKQIPRPMISFLSQGFVSGAGFSVSLSLLYFGSKDNYASFVLFINAYALLASLQNALFIAPLVTLSPRLSNSSLKSAERYLGMVTISLALLGVFFTFFWQSNPKSGMNILHGGILSVLAFLLLLKREGTRNSCLVRGDFFELLRIDFLYFSLTIAIVVCVIVFGRVTFIMAALTFSLPSLVSLLARPVRQFETSSDHLSGAVNMNQDFWPQMWACTRWALPGVLVTWLFSNGYWFLLERTSGKTAVAELGASRIFFTPVGLMIQGWVSMYRPMAANMVHRGEWKHLHSTMIKHGIVGATIAIVFTVIISIGLIGIPAMRPKVANTGLFIPLIGGWGAYFAIQFLRNAISATVLASTSGYRTVFRISTLSCSCFYGFFVLSRFINPLLTCLIGLIATELLMVLLLNKDVKCLFLPRS